MTKNEAKSLKNGQKVYFLGINYIVEECTVEEVHINEENGVVELILDDGCVEYFDDNNHKYIFESKKEALDAAEYELESMLNMILENKKIFQQGN